MAAADAPPVVDPAAVVEELRSQGVRLVVLSMVDNGGITRIKVVPTARLERAALAGIGMSDVWALSCVDDHFAFLEAPELDSPSGDMRLVPDLAALALLPAPGYAWAPARQLDQELAVVDVCQRSALARAVEGARADGIELLATYELECTLLGPDLAPATTGPGYSPRALLPLQALAVDLVDALETAGVPVDQLHPEYAPGQFEVSVAAADPVTAADRLVLMRILVRQVAARHGLHVSFAPVVLPGEVGNGCHLHLSPWRDGANLLTGGDGPGGLTGEGASFIAGMLEQLPALTAVVAPSVPSYLRLLPGHWSGAYTVWGVENREAPLRLIPGSRTTRSSSANVELKTVDGAANPYLAALAAVAAGLDGLRRGLPLRAPVQVDPARLDPAEQQRLAVQRLPTSLGEAADALAASVPLRAAFGDRLLDAYLAVRRHEAAAFAELDEHVVVERHRFAY